MGWSAGLTLVKVGGVGMPWACAGGLGNRGLDVDGGAIDVSVEVELRVIWVLPAEDE